MSMPQNILMIQPTMTMAVRIWMKAAAMFSQNTQHMWRSGRSVRAPHSTVKADTNVPKPGTKVLRNRHNTATGNGMYGIAARKGPFFSLTWTTTPLVEEVTPFSFISVSFWSILSIKHAKCEIFITLDEHTSQKMTN